VEVAFLEGHVAIRDSKDEQSPLLLFDQEAWQEFIGGARHAEFDIPTADPPSLMERARRQLDEEVAAFYGAHRKALRSYLLGLGCREADVEDIIQDSALIVREKWLRGGQTAHPKAYWFKIAQRLMYRDQRQRRRFLTTLDDEVYLQNLADGIDGVAMVDGLVVALSIIRRLPLRQRQVLWLRGVVGFTEAETAAVLAIRVGTVKSQLHDAKARLKELSIDAGEQGEEVR
jgi:RNA polymerase sigma-70 factor (ECF subfamily)